MYCGFIIMVSLFAHGHINMALKLQQTLATETAAFSASEPNLDNLYFLAHNLCGCHAVDSSGGAYNACLTDEGDFILPAKISFFEEVSSMGSNINNLPRNLNLLNTKDLELAGYVFNSTCANRFNSKCWHKGGHFKGGRSKNHQTIDIDPIDNYLINKFGEWFLMDLTELKEMFSNLLSKKKDDIWFLNTCGSSLLSEHCDWNANVCKAQVARFLAVTDAYDLDDAYDVATGWDYSMIAENTYKRCGIWKTWKQQTWCEKQE